MRQKRCDIKKQKFQPEDKLTECEREESKKEESRKII